MNPRLILAGGLLLAASGGHAQLAVDQFSTTNPITIMPVGDSITDDCEEEGAWRRYFQPLADSNSVPFNFVGRQRSDVIGPFNKIHHEGYCGTVIAPPGVYAVHQYSESQAYLENIVPEAFTNAKPNVVIVMIGANDIGRGRNPYTVATNDMANLLDIIFSNLPNAFVILDRPTTLRNAEAPPLNYGLYATNIPIYSAALQGLVNERRALGQNVCLADMFSVVDYATMFLGDHLHPNPTGMAVVAKEWFTRLLTMLTGTNRITASLIRQGDLWMYSDAGTDLGTNWSQPGFDDSAWNAGNGRFGYGELTDATIVNTNTTTYFRKTFVVPWNEVFTNLNFRMTVTAGAAVWLNGRPLYQTNLPAGPSAFTNLATTNLTGDPANIYYQTNIAGTNLLVGTNVVAVEVHPSGATNAPSGFDLELLGGAYVLPPPTLVAGTAGPNIALSWPTNTGSTFTLYEATNIIQPVWQPANVAMVTNRSQVQVTIAPQPGSMFFRLQRNQ